MDCFFVVVSFVFVLLLFLLHGSYFTRNAFLNFVIDSDCWLCCWHWRPCCWHWLLAMLLTLSAVLWTWTDGCVVTIDHVVDSDCWLYISGRWGKSRSKYLGRNSEGNRFITDIALWTASILATGTALWRHNIRMMCRSNQIHHWCGA